MAAGGAPGVRESAAAAQRAGGAAGAAAEAERVHEVEAALRAAEAAMAATAPAAAPEGGGEGDAMRERLARVQRSWQRRGEGGGGEAQAAALRGRAAALRAQVAACSAAIAQLQWQLLELSSGSGCGGDEREWLARMATHPSLRSPEDLRRAVRALFAACVAESVRAADQELAVAGCRDEAARHVRLARKRRRRRRSTGARRCSRSRLRRSGRSRCWPR